MFTSDERRLIRFAVGDAAAAGFFAFFGGVYELFSHEVYSYWMIYAFAFPLLLGVLPMLLHLKGERQRPDARTLTVWHCGLAALTVGSVMRGVVEIYGSTNRLLYVYPYAGLLLLAAAAIRERNRHDAAQERKEGSR